MPEENNPQDEVVFLGWCSSSPAPLCPPGSHAKVHSLQILRAHKVHPFPSVLTVLTTNQRGIESAGREAPSVPHCGSPCKARNIIPNLNPCWGVTDEVCRDLHPNTWTCLLSGIFVSLKEMFVKQLHRFWWKKKYYVNREKSDCSWFCNLFS